MGLEGACSAGHWRAARDWLWPFGRKRISSVTLAEMAVVIPPLRAEMPEKWRTSAPQARQWRDTWRPWVVIQKRSWCRMSMAGSMARPTAGRCPFP